MFCDWLLDFHVISNKTKWFLLHGGEWLCCTLPTSDFELFMAWHCIVTLLMFDILLTSPWPLATACCMTWSYGERYVTVQQLVVGHTRAKITLSKHIVNKCRCRSKIIKWHSVLCFHSNVWLGGVFVHHPVVLSYVLNYVVLLNYACMYIEFMFLYKNYMNGYCMMLGCHVPYYKWQHS